MPHSAAASLATELLQRLDAAIPAGAGAADYAVVIGRAARVALLRDEAWFGPLIGGLLPKVGVAPNRAAVAALPWLPYDVALLQRIAGLVGVLLRRA
jgi:hypothetical protein